MAMLSPQLMIIAMIMIPHYSPRMQRPHALAAPVEVSPPPAVKRSTLKKCGGRVTGSAAPEILGTRVGVASPKWLIAVGGLC